MEIPRGHAMLPLNDADFIDFIFNYFKAEYSPIRSFWATATAEPRQPQRWISMGHELSPLSFRPANAQAQKDLESLDYWVRQKNLDSGFVRGIVIRYAKYELHERLEKKLYESCRLDLMVRKALKEKHLIDVLWPSPAPRNTNPDFLQQGIKVRQWYGDMFSKYFRRLHSVDDFTLRPEVDAKIKSSGTLMLVPFVDHLVFGAVDPIMPIIARGAGYANSAAWKQKDKGRSFGEPDRFEIRFDTPAEIEDTHTRSVVRQCQCLKCGTKRDVTVVISIDPSPGPIGPQTAGKPNTSAPRRQGSKAAQRYSPGYSMPGANDNPPQQTAPPPAQAQELPAENRSASPLQKKQCLRCTFLNHPDLTVCEMCQGELPDTLVAKPPSPKVSSKAKSSHSHSASHPPPVTIDSQSESLKEATRPAVPNRHSLSSSLFSIFPFNQQQQSEHHAKLPPTQPAEFNEGSQPIKREERGGPEISKAKEKYQPRPSKATPTTETNTAAPNFIDTQPEPPSQLERSPTPPFSQPPEMAMMPLTPPPTSSENPRHLPGMPQNLMDDFVSISPSFQRDDEEDAGWGEVSKEKIKKGEDSDSDDEDGANREMIDLDLVAREEMGVWGHKEDDD